MKNTKKSIIIHNIRTMLSILDKNNIEYVKEHIEVNLYHLERVKKRVKNMSNTKERRLNHA